MKRFYYLFLFFFLLSFSSMFGQKAKFKSKACVVQKVRLPIHYSEPDQRTYDLLTKGRYASGVNPHSKKIYGWEQTNNNPNVKGVVSIYGYAINSPKRGSQKKEKKNKEGKVTDSWTEYWYTNSAQGRATLYVYGIDQPFEYKKRNEEKPKSKAEIKKEEEKKDLADNPFLSADVIEEAEENDIGIDEGIEDAQLGLVNSIKVDRSIDVKTKTYRRSSEAYKEYTGTQRGKLYDYKNKFPTDAYKSAISNLNRLYGFAPSNNRFYLKTMKSEKHPEFKMWNDACQAVGTIFKTFSYNEDIAAKQKQFDPILAYFGGIVNKIPESDKKQQKLKRAAYNNILNMMYYLDRHDEVMTLADKYMNSKKLDKISKKLKERSAREKAHLAFHKMENRHVKSTEEVIADDIETEEAEDDVEGN